MKKLLKKVLFGITLPQEYLCVSLKDFNNFLKVFITYESTEQDKDISKHHLLIGYKPLVVAIDKKYFNDIALTELQHLILSYHSDNQKEVASLKVKLIHEVKLKSMTCFIFEGVKGVNSFTNPFHKLIKSLHYNLTADKKKNVFLAGNLYEQVKIAYSVPRYIYLASVGSTGLFNIFPTDLSGKIGEDNFIMSLRRGGKANMQIEKEGKCIVATMEADSFMEVYDAGRNHMKELSEATSLGIRLRSERSTNFNLPVPLGAIQYHELEKIDKFEVGIHTIHFFRLVNSVSLNNNRSILAHIHRDYAGWRLRNGITTNYLIRK